MSPFECVGLAAEQCGERVREPYGLRGGIDRDHALLPEALLEEVLTLAAARAVEHGAVERFVARPPLTPERELQAAGAGTFVVVAEWIPGAGLCALTRGLEPGAEIVLDQRDECAERELLVHVRVQPDREHLGDQVLGHRVLAEAGALAEVA